MLVSADESSPTVSQLWGRQSSVLVLDGSTGIIFHCSNRSVTSSIIWPRSSGGWHPNKRFRHCYTKYVLPLRRIAAIRPIADDYSRGKISDRKLASSSGENGGDILFKEDRHRPTADPNFFGPETIPSKRKRESTVEGRVFLFFWTKQIRKCFLADRPTNVPDDFLRWSILSTFIRCLIHSEDRGSIWFSRKQISRVNSVDFIHGPGTTSAGCADKKKSSLLTIIYRHYFVNLMISCEDGIIIGIGYRRWNL